MPSIRSALTAAACAAAALTTAGPALAATSAPAAHVRPADCHIRFYFNQNSYVYLHPDASSTRLGLAYTNDTFVDRNRSSNGFRYGTDGRSGGKTGWVRAANISQQKVCS